MRIEDLRNAEQLERTREFMEYITQAIGDGIVTSLRIGLDFDGVKFSVNYGTWSPGIKDGTE